MLLGLWASLNGTPYPRFAWACFAVAFLLAIWTIMTWEPAARQLRRWKRSRSSTKKRLDIGCNVSPQMDERGIRVYDMYLPITNFGRTDSFMIQIISLQPPPSGTDSLPWSLRWEGSTDESIKIIHDHTRTLHFCRTDLTGELRDSQSGHWKPGRIWFFTPQGQKEVFMSMTGVQSSSDIYNLRLEVVLCITALSREEKMMWRLTIGFNRDTSPQIVSLQPI
jgi:hypothetical protein